MSDNTVLYNRSVTKDGTIILAVGLNEEGVPVTPQVAPTGETGTIQVNAEMVVTSDTYEGDDADILDFFTRGADDENYGIFYTSDTKDSIIKLTKIQPVLNKYMGHLKETPHQGSMVFMMSKILLSNTDQSVEDIIKTIEEVMEAAFNGEPLPAPGNIMLYQKDAAEGGSVGTISTYVWYENEDGVMWHVGLVPTSATLTSKSLDLSPHSVSGTSSIVFNPYEVFGYNKEFFVVMLSTNSDNEKNAVKVIRFLTIDNGE